MRIVALSIALMIGGCGGARESVDAGPMCTAQVDPAECWPDLVHVPQGTVTLGTGRAAFEDMPEMLPLEYGTQGGFDLVANVRMTGFFPGNPENIVDPSNPRTRIRAFFDDTNVPLDAFSRCPTRTAYVPSSAGGYEFPAGVGVVFELCWRSDRLFGKRIRIELELMDDCGGYASAVKVVTAAPPTRPGYPIEDNTPGCVHATDL